VASVQARLQHPVTTHQRRMPMMAYRPQEALAPPSPLPGANSVRRREAGSWVRRRPVADFRNALPWLHATAPSDPQDLFVRAAGKPHGGLVAASAS